MYHALNQIQWMDVTEGKVYTDEIRHFFRKYIHKTHSFRHGNMMVEEIDFDGMIVKVTDMFGWTDIVRAQCINIDVDPTNIPKWTEFKCENKTLLVSNEQDMLTYCPEHVTRGFHGEAKYETVIKDESDLKVNEDILRLKRGGVDSNFNDIEFAPLSFRQRLDDDDSSFGYVFETRSGTMNISDVHCISKNIIW